MERATSSVIAELKAAKGPRVAVLRALMLGDLLCSVPAFRALRAALPHAEITLVGLPWAAEFTRRFAGYFDEFVEFPGYPGLPERKFLAADIARFLTTVQARQFDLAIQMHGSGAHVNSLIALFGARRTAGYRTADAYCDDPENYLPYPESVPEVQRHMALTAFLGATAHGTELEFPLFAEDRSAAERLAESTELRLDRTVILHPGARYPSRRWSPDRFAAVADALSEEGLDIAVTGTASESPLADELIAQAHTRAVNFVGRTSLGTLAALVERARLVVSNDTGIAHLADAIGTPSVVVVLGSDVQRWRPLDARRHPAVVAGVDCSPCEYVECPIGHICNDAVTPAIVIDAAERLLARTSRMTQPQCSLITH